MPFICVCCVMLCGGRSEPAHDNEFFINTGVCMVYAEFSLKKSVKNETPELQSI